MKYILIFICGMIVGEIIGLLLHCLMIIAKESDERIAK